jgi:hypothetical protein
MRRLAPQAILLTILATLFGCTVIGRGSRTIVRATCALADEEQGACAYAVHHYPNLLYSGEGGEAQRVLLINGNGAPATNASDARRQQALDDFRKYLSGKYGHPDFKAAQISFNVHDRSTAPGLLPYDVTQLVATSVASLITGNPKIPQGDVTQLEASLQAHLRNVPDVPQVTVWHHTENGSRVYYYYPHLSLDFSAQYPSSSSYDRLSYLALVVRLKQKPSSRTARFLDFTPKQADLAPFSRGGFSQTTGAQAQVAYGVTASTTKTTGVAPSVTAATNGTTLGSGSGPTIGVTNSDVYTDTLLDTIERRTVGILDEGQTFFADLRAVREVRIAGTYNFDLMLEVPAVLVTERPYARSVPVEPEIKADVFLIGVVRHVYQRGDKGFILKVPETENDQVYEQVLLKVAADRTLWKFVGEPYFERVVVQEAVCKVKVVANRDDATYILEDGNGRQSASGSGKDGTFDLAELEPAKCRGRVVFLPVLVSSEKSGAQFFVAKPVPIDAPDKEAPILVKGEYLPKRITTSPHR